MSSHAPHGKCSEHLDGARAARGGHAEAIRVQIARLWDGSPAAARESVELRFGERCGDLHISIDAPFHGDPAPAVSPGRLDGLWNHEVVECFLLGGDDCYLELEFGPHGHYLALAFRGARGVCVSDLRIEYRATLRGERWSGAAVVAPALLPLGLDRANAYAIHGVGAARRYLAHTSVPGAVPDFHRLDAFLEWSSPLGITPTGEVFERLTGSASG